MTALKRELGDVLYATATLKIPYNSTLDVYGNPDADFSAFRAAAQQAARECYEAELRLAREKRREAPPA